VEKILDNSQRMKIEKREGKIISGKNTFQQFIVRHFIANVNNLNFGRAHQNQFLIADQNGNLRQKDFVTDGVPIFKHVFDSDQSTFRSFITGRASLAGDKLSVIGDPENTVIEIDLTFEELEEGTKEFNRFAWKTNICFFPANWEVGSEGNWSISIYVPSRIFRMLVADIEANRRPEVSISVDTDLWANEHHQHMPLAQNITWYLQPDSEGRSDRMPKSAEGNVTSIGFTNKTLHGAASSERSSLENVGGTDYAYNLKAIHGTLRLIGVAIFIVAAAIIFKP
jgi:hypothetical protein